MENGYDDESPWVELWSSEMRRERYQHCEREHYETAKSLMDISIKSNFEYGKWLLASGLAVHGGALFGLNSLRDALEHDKWSALADAAKWNVGGIVFVLIAGFLAWLNFQSAVHIYHRAANPMRIYRTDTFNEDDAKTDIMSFTRWLAIAAGFLALYSVLVSAVKVFRLLDTI